MDMIDQIGGWRSVSSMGNSYGDGYKIQQLIEWFSKMEVS